MSDEPTKSNWTPEQGHQHWIEFIEMLYDLLDGGESFEELAIGFEIVAAGSAIPKEGVRSCLEIVHDALEEITKAREAGLNRNEVLAHMNATAKP